MKIIIQIAAGILLAGLISLAIRAAYIGYLANELTAEVEEMVSKQKAEASRLKAESAARKKAEKNQKLAAESLRRKKVQENAAFDRAWNAHYVTPRDCLVFKSDRHMVECVAAKKQAKKEFLRIYNQARTSAN